jgi:hypothetical protein
MNYLGFPISNFTDCFVFEGKLFISIAPVIGEGEGVPALCEVRVPAAQVVHARYCLHLQPLDQVRDQG